MKKLKLILIAAFMLIILNLVNLIVECSRNYIDIFMYSSKVSQLNNNDYVA